MYFPPAASAALGPVTVLGPIAEQEGIGPFCKPHNRWTARMSLARVPASPLRHRRFDFTSTSSDRILVQARCKSRRRSINHKAPPTTMAESAAAPSAAAPASTDTLEQAALKVLVEGDPWLKAEYGDLAATLWLEGKMPTAYDESGPLLTLPSRPARLDIVRLVAPRDMPKLGRGGSLQSRQALVHSLVHTESWAIDLSWDIIARFGKAEAMPREFFDDFVRVAQDEGRHFRSLAARLKELNSSYGALPAHDGLWDSAEATAHDLKARLAVEHCVHEARGLDVLPTTVSRFRKGGDEETAKLLESVIYPDEITHCAAGVKWFSYLCLRDTPKDHSGGENRGSPQVATEYQVENGDGLATSAGSDVVAAFHGVVRKYFRGPLKPPFNEAARAAAGFGPEWYLPLATKVAAADTDHLR